MTTPMCLFTQNDFFRYKEQIYALYADYSHNFGSHFSMKAGLRLEHTRTTGISESQQTTDKHDYTRLFPTFYLMYKPNEDNVLNMKYIQPHFASGTEYGESFPYLRKQI